MPRRRLFPEIRAAIVSFTKECRQEPSPATSPTRIALRVEKRAAAHARRRFKRKKRRVLAFKVCTEWRARRDSNTRPCLRRTEQTSQRHIPLVTSPAVS